MRLLPREVGLPATSGEPETAVLPAMMVLPTLVAALPEKPPNVREAALALTVQPITLAAAIDCCTRLRR